MKFTPEGGSITIRTSDEPAENGEGPLMAVEVGDTGIGIEPEVLPYIFEPFRQGESTITRRFGGLGLGLAICKGVIDSHGGMLTIESAGKDRGATFGVLLRTTHEGSIPGDIKPVKVQARGAGRPLSSPLSVLVVEDEPATLRLMAGLLRQLGHAVATASTIAAGFGAFHAGQADLVLSDVGLPDGTGLELIGRIVALRCPIPSIALTGYGTVEDIRKSREAGFTTHMIKPIDFKQLEETIRLVAR